MNNSMQIVDMLMVDDDPENNLVNLCLHKMSLNRFYITSSIITYTLKIFPSKDVPSKCEENGLAQFIRRFSPRFLKRCSYLNCSIPPYF